MNRLKKKKNKDIRLKHSVFYDQNQSLIGKQKIYLYIIPTIKPQEFDIYLFKDNGLNFFSFKFHNTINTTV